MAGDAPMGLRAAARPPGPRTERVRPGGSGTGQERLLDLQPVGALRQDLGAALMISRSHVRLAVLSVVATLTVSTLTVARGEVAPVAGGTVSCPLPAGPVGSGGSEPTAAGSTGSGGLDSTATGASSAAEAHGWGAPVWCAEFDDHLDPADWVVYDSAGHGGEGRRSPDQLFLGNGSLYLYGRADGTTAGLGSRHSQAYGRWETRVRMYDGADSYHPIALLWPDGGGGGVDSATGEEIDFLGVMDRPGRWRANFYLETPQGEEQSYSEVDMTDWHTYAVENGPGGVVGYLDGREWFRSPLSTRSPMSACLQLDWFPGHGSPGEAWMEVDWLRIYPLDAGGTG
ncbi:glycoside hydrolase family 16 protein [Streptosporangium sp. CA-135522]|uniref:glycoside hydrolase family 16 protein n=1 Tax=Streptosporangium sp. CA-135522 TaxID=3240072 RepID=UPI003D8D7A86